jgi:hypothetical protein
MRIRGWVALLAVAGSANVSCVLAQGSTIYKCTDSDGRTSFSDQPCAMSGPGAAGSAGTGKDGVRQEVVRQPKPSADHPSADSIAAMCAKSEGSKPSDEVINSLAEAQRKMVVTVLRSLVVGAARDRAQQANLQRVTLRVDASRTAIICMPQQRAQPSGGRIDTYTAFRVEPNGRMVTLQPAAEPLVDNDANEPATMASRCSSMVTSCVRSQPKTPASIDPCFEKTPVCPGGRLDPAANCCPQACKDAYRRERAAGTDPESAFIKVIFGDEAGAVSCIPGMPRKG